MPELQSKAWQDRAAPNMAAFAIQSMGAAARGGVKSQLLCDIGPDAFAAFNANTIF